MIWLFNLILPGTGLILRRREWLGLCLTMIFSICGNVAIAGIWIAPDSVPGRLTHTAVAMLVGCWVLAQYLCHRQGSALARNRGLLLDLLEDARSALKQGDVASTRRALDRGRAVDDEAAELFVLGARLAALEGDAEAMKDSWRRVIKLDRKGRFSREAQEGLRRSVDAGSDTSGS